MLGIFTRQRAGLLGACAVITTVAAVAVSTADAEPQERDAAILFVQLPAPQYPSDAPGRADGMLRADYGEAGRIVSLAPDGTVRVLTEGFAGACEFDVSFDGQSILFAGQQAPGETWNIWEMKADGTAARRITEDQGNCRMPAYQATLYTIVSTEPWAQIMFASDAAGALNEYGSNPALSVYSCRLDGGAARRLTLNLSDDMDPLLMPDGRVLLASWQRMDLRRGRRGRVALFGINSDGADYALYCGDQGGRIKHMPCVTDSGLAVFVEADRVGWDGAGQLGAVTLRRHFYSHRAITAADDGWLYHSPAPLPGGDVVVAARRADGPNTHGLYRLDPDTGRRKLIYDDPEFHDIHPRRLAPRPRPDGRSSVVNEKYATGKLYCLNASVTDSKWMGHTPPGTIRRLRVIEGVPDVPGGDRGGPAQVVRKRLLGDIEVAADGSFQIEVPADVPIQLQTLDADGMALRSCGWIWAKHREPRGCIGCHEDPELTPPNVFVMAVRQPAPKLTLPPERRRTVTFAKDVQPVIKRNCAACHAKQADAPDLTAATLRGHVNPGRARTSPLIWRLYGRNTSRPWDTTYAPDQNVVPHPPAGADALTAADRAAFVEWVDLGARTDAAAVPPGEEESR